MPLSRSMCTRTPFSPRSSSTTRTRLRAVFVAGMIVRHGNANRANCTTLARMATVSPASDLERFFNLSLEMICVAGFDGYFKRLSPSWRVLGFTEAELMAKPYVEFIHPDDRHSTIAAASQVEAGVKLIKFRNRYLAKDGSYRWFSWNAVPFPDQELIYAVARDITDIKRREDRQAAAYAVTRVLATSTSLNAAALEILHVVCDGLSWSAGAIWSVDREVGVIRCIEL